MSFNKLSVKSLKHLISTFKKEHNLANYSKLKKKELVALLEQKFTLKDGQMFLKYDTVPPPVQKVKKRIVPELISALPPPPVQKVKKRIVPELISALPPPPVQKVKKRIVPELISALPPVQKAKKRIVPELISAPTSTPIPQPSNGLTTGQQTYVSAINKIENRENARRNYAKEQAFFNRIKGK